MKKLYPLILILGLFIFPGTTITNAQWNLGDIAFTTYNSDGTADQFSFVLLRSVTSGESISFTDNGWFAAGGFRSTEDTLTLTFSANYSCGSQIFISASPFGARDESMTSAGVLVGSALAISASGDQIFAYDPNNAPSATDSSGFIAAISMNGAWDTDATSSNTSALPGVFTDGVNALSISPEVDNAQYNCSVTSASPTTLLTTLNNSANWNVDDANNYAVPAPCTITCSAPPCNNPDVPNVLLNPQTVCDGDSSLMTIIGNRNDATRWSVYTGSCGGTLVDSTSGNSMMVQITGSSITFFVRGEGGCVTPGTCGQVTGFGIPLDDASFAYPDTNFCTSNGPVTPTATTSGGTYSSSPAGLNLTPSTGVIDPSLSTPNSYTVYYTTNGTCPATDSVTIHILNCTGIKQQTVTGTFAIYPNPSNGNFEVTLNDFKVGSQLSIVDVLGKEVYATTLKANRTSLNMTSLKKGVYFVKVFDQNKQDITRVIIR